MLFFTKKKEVKRPIPVEEVVELSRKGKTDKEIIRQLKSEGFSYDEIEKAMLLAMKSSVGKKEEKPETKQPAQQPVQQQPFPQGPSLPVGEDFSHLNKVHSGSQYSSQQLEQNPQPQQPQQFQQEMNVDVDMEPVDVNNIVEDIIQSIVDEKWEKIDAKMKEIEKELAATKKYVSSIKIPESQNIDKSELDLKFKEIDTKLEDLEVRVGALEKSFKQLLPSLVENIQNLSNIVDTLKKRHEDLERKALEHIYGEQKPWNTPTKE